MMEIKDQIKQLADRITELKGEVRTEAATKSAFIMPMLKILGYDVHNPIEVVPEFTADIGAKKGEKVDYAIVRDGKPVILIECKHWERKLNIDDAVQLVRYFHAANAQVGILTNGIKYQFYVAIDKANIMDGKPFFEFDVTDTKANFEELEKYTKSEYDYEKIVETATDLKYKAAIRSIIQDEVFNPSEWFVRAVAKLVYKGNVNSNIMEQFTVFTKESFSRIINDMIDDQLGKVRAMSAVTSGSETSTESESQIVTTEEEMEGFYTVRAALRNTVSMDRISFKDTASYFGIQLDGSTRKTICRLYFNGTKKYISTFDENKKETRHELKQMDDVFKHTDAMIRTIKYYDDPARAAKLTEASEPEIGSSGDDAR